jgi:hypothetical protein
VLLAGMGIAYVFARFLGKIGVLAVDVGENGLNAFKVIMAGFLTTGKLTDKITEEKWELATQEDFGPVIKAAFLALLAFLLPPADVSIIVQNPDVIGAFLTVYALISIGWTVLVLAGEKTHVEMLQKRSAHNLNRLNMGAGALIFLAAAVSGFAPVVQDVFTALGQLLIGATTFLVAVLKGHAGLPLLPLVPALAGLALAGIGIRLFRPGADAAFKRERTWLMGAFGIMAFYCFLCVACATLSWGHEKDVLTIKGGKTNAELAETVAKAGSSASNPGGRRALEVITGAKLVTTAMSSISATTTTTQAPTPAQVEAEEEEEEDEEEDPRTAWSDSKKAFCEAHPGHAWCRN